MTINQNCTRALLICISDKFDLSLGRRVKPVKLKRIIEDECLIGFTNDEIFTSAQYLIGKKLVSAVEEDPMKIAPRYYVFTAITAKGQDYLTAIKDNSVWSRLSKKVGNVFEQSIPALIAAAAELGIKLFGG